MTLKQGYNAVEQAPCGGGRRILLKGALAGTTAAVLGAPAIARARSKAALSFALWGEPVPVSVLKDIAARYSATHPDVEVTVQATPGGPQYYQQIDTRIAGHNAPDLMRFEYAAIGRYGNANVLMDLSGKLDANYGKDFLPTLWSAVTSHGKIYAVPANLDTEAIFYNVDVFNSLGIKPPETIEKSWTWAEFIDVAKKLQAAKKTPFPFGMEWQNSPFRWMPFLYQHGGQLLSDDLKSQMVDSKVSIETIQWLQSWFTDRLVPPSTSIKSSDDPTILFANGTLAMCIGGDWKIPALTSAIGDRFKWSVTHTTRDKNFAADIGGSCWGITRRTKHPDEAIDFLKYLTSANVQRDFVSRSQYLPARISLLKDITYKDHQDERRIFIDQAQTIPPNLVASVSIPQFSKINLKMGDELDLAFTSGQSAERTAQNIAGYITSML
jgi:multiple sugar transport system substrate-binding protein